LGGTEIVFWHFSVEVSEAEVRLGKRRETHFLLLMGVERKSIELACILPQGL
jgi:hypothetical protein